MTLVPPWDGGCGRSRAGCGPCRWLLALLSGDPVDHPRRGWACWCGGPAARPGRRCRADRPGLLCAHPPPSPLPTVLVVELVLLAGLLRRLELRVVRANPLGTVDLDPAVGLGIGDVHAVLAHAPGERQQLLLLLRVELGGPAAVWPILLAGLLRRLEPRSVRVDPGWELLGHVTGRVDLGVGHVDAVLAHAPAVRQRPPPGVAAAAGAGGGGGLVGAAEAGHPVAVVTVTAGPNGQRHGRHGDQRGQVRPPVAAWWVCRASPAAVIVHETLLSFADVPRDARPQGTFGRAAPGTSALSVWTCAPRGCRCSDRAVTRRERPL